MPRLRVFTIFAMILFLVFVYGCSKGTDEVETAAADAAGHTHEAGEQAEHAHGEEAGHTHEGEGHAEEGEEADLRIPLDGIHDAVRKGARLILRFDSESAAFMGTVENVTEKALSRVRIEVHLSNGEELGPTPPIDLDPGKKVEVKLSVEGQSFDWWKAHAEVGSSEH